MLQTDLNLTSFATRRVRERQNLLAPTHGAPRLFLLLRIAVSRLLVPLQNLLLVLTVVSGGLDCSGANLANRDLPAVDVGLWTLVRFV